MSSLKSIQTKMEKMEKLQKEIEEAKREIQETMGKKIIELLEIDYDLLSSKKDIDLVVNEIKDNLPNNLFNTSNTNSNSDVLEKDDITQPNNNQSNTSSNY